MIVSGEVQYFHGVGVLTRRDPADVEAGHVGVSLKGAIAPRYRDGLGGIDLEQVRRDQRQARRQVVRAMIQRLEQLWRQR